MGGRAQPDVDLAHRLSRAEPSGACARLLEGFLDLVARERTTGSSPRCAEGSAASGDIRRDCLAQPRKAFEYRSTIRTPALSRSDAYPPTLRFSIVDSDVRQNALLERDLFVRMKGR